MSQEIDYSNIIPHSLRPICRAYALGHLTTTAPRLFGFLRLITRRKDLALDEKLSLLKQILKSSTQLNRFPTACAIIIGGATALPRLVKTILQWLLNTLNNANGRNSTKLSSKTISRVRYLCSFLSAWLAFNLLNRDEEWARKRAMSLSISQKSSLPQTSNMNTDTSTDDTKPKSKPSTLSLPIHHSPPTPMLYAGKTTDFTLFALTRALSTLTSTIYTKTLSSPSHPSRTHPTLTNLATNLASPFLFSLSATIIMFSWFYSPERLPRSYRTWISTAADIDPSLIQALRLARQGEFVYGQETGQSHLLADLCHKIGRPSSYGDPKITIPVPCELYHSGAGRSCEVHALRRWIKGWSFAMKLYLPLQILTRIKSIVLLLRMSLSNTVLTTGSKSREALSRLYALSMKLVKSASLSSSFLATFISLFYYGVCLARTRLGPRLFPSVSPQAWDSGLCVLAGCLACGWSILLEEPARRYEIAQFMAPRAMATLLPRVYDRREQWKEKVVFATSVAIVMGGVVDGGAVHVKGVLGRVLGGVARQY